jgi:hypothetical protein
MAKRYDNPKELSKLLLETRRLKQSANRSPYTVILTILCYGLWKDYRYSQRKLADFCRKFAEYDERYFDKPYQTLVDELYNYADWKVEHVKYTKDDYPHYKSKVMQASVEEQMRCANEINALSTRYFTYGFYILIEDGFGVKKLTNFKDKAQKRIQSITGDMRTGTINDLWKELATGAGIYIEKPKID